MATKTILGAALLGLLAAACGGEDAQMAPPPPAPAPEPPPPPPVAATPPPKPTMLEMQIALAKNLGAVINEPEKAAALYAPDAILWTVGQPEQKGRDAILKGAQDLTAMFGDMKSANSRLWTKGNTMVVQWVTTGTDKASGKPASISGCEIVTLNDDGLIAAEHDYYDVEAIMEQTGAYKGQKPAPPLLPLPTDPVEVHTAKNDATEQTNAANVAAMNAAVWDKKDDKAFLGFIDDGITTWNMAENGATPHDKKFMIASMAAGRKAADFGAYKDTNVIAVEDFTIDEGVGTITQKAPYSFDKFHIPNTRKSATTHGLEIDQWKDGKIVKSWNWSSAMELDTQLGIGPAAPAKPVKSRASRAAAK